VPGTPPKPQSKIHLPHRRPTSLNAIWDNALTLASTLSDHYSMRRNEQKFALQLALLLDTSATLVELGVTHGHTAAILCYAAKLKGFTYYGVDNFCLEGKPQDVTENLQALNLPFNLIVGNTNTVPWKKPIDYLLIDGGHDVVNVTQDTIRWTQFLKPGGLVLFHDYNATITQSDPHWGIKNAADTYCYNWEIIAFEPWLLVKRKPLA
jgi:hypothetical protein